MPKVGRPYGLRNQGIARQKVSVQGQRAILAYPELARRVAKGEMTKTLRGTRQQMAGLPGDGQNLKDGVTAMGTRLNVDDATMKRLSEMDQQTLADMYNSNEMVFEVYFNYGGLQKTAEGEWSDYSQGQKQKDVQFFIEQYNRFSASKGGNMV